MKSQLIPEGSTLIATVLRPLGGGGGVGTKRMIAASPLGNEIIVEAIAGQLPTLFDNARFPELLVPGPPLIMLLQVILPDERLYAFSAAAVLNRAASRAEMIEAWKRDLPSIVGALQQIVHEALEIAAFGPSPNSPPKMVH